MAFVGVCVLSRLLLYLTVTSSCPSSFLVVLALSLCVHSLVLRRPMSTRSALPWASPARALATSPPSTAARLPPCPPSRSPLPALSSPSPLRATSSRHPTGACLGLLGPIQRTVLHGACPINGWGTVWWLLCSLACVPCTLLQHSFRFQDCMPVS